MRGPHAACTLEPREADCRFPLASGGKASIGLGGSRRILRGGQWYNVGEIWARFPGAPQVRGTQ